MTREELLAKRMNQLPMVSWDRWGGFDDFGDGERSAASAFGWIERGDGRSDFVLLLIYVRETADGIWEEEMLWENTSSPSYSKEISEILELDGHNDCRRIEDDFGDLVERKISLDPDGPLPPDYWETAE